jgi:hypothetical protein
VDLLVALKTPPDLAPGPDGKPYIISKKLWSIAGSFILKSWKYRCNTELLPALNSNPEFTLLPKEDKNTKDIKNWRLITFPNGESKIMGLKIVKSSG